LDADWTPSSGKSYVASEVFEAAGWAFETINMHSAVTAGQIIGKYDPNDKGAFVWHDGPLIRAMKDGKPLLIEEANAMTSAVSLCLYAPMDKDPKKRKLTLIAHEGETITAHPDFRLVLTGNLGYRGTERFNPAIQNRIADYISLPYLSQELEAQLLMKTSKIDKDTAQNMARVASAVPGSEVVREPEDPAGRQIGHEQQRDEADADPRQLSRWDRALHRRRRDV